MRTADGAPVHDESGSSPAGCISILPTEPTCGIAVMAKASVPGLTKTRLVPPLDFEEAAAFNTGFLLDIAANLLTAGQQARIAPYMAFGPPDGREFFLR